METRNIVDKIRNKRKRWLYTRHVDAKVVKIKSTWTREMVFDIDHYHSIDSTAGLEEYLAQEMKGQSENK